MQSDVEGRIESLERKIDELERLVLEQKDRADRLEQTLYLFRGSVGA